MSPMSATLAALFAGAAVWAGLLGHAEYRATLAERALSRADGLPSEDERNAEFERAAEILAGWRPTGRLREIQARLDVTRTPPALEDSSAASHAALARNPAREESWARLAYLDAARHGALTEEGVAALNRSFVAAPYRGAAFQLWRVEFGLTYWSFLDAEGRAHVSRAVTALMQARRTAERLRALADRLQNPDARQFLMQRLEPPAS